MAIASWTVTDHTLSKWLMLKANLSTANSISRYEGRNHYRRVGSNFHLTRRLIKASATLMPAKLTNLLPMIQTIPLGICTTQFPRRNFPPGPLKFKWWPSSKLRNSAGIPSTWQRCEKSLIRSFRNYPRNSLFVLPFRFGHRPNSLWSQSAEWCWIVIPKTILLKLNRLHSALLIWFLVLNQARIRCFRYT